MATPAVHLPDLRENQHGLSQPASPLRKVSDKVRSTAAPEEAGRQAGRGMMSLRRAEKITGHEVSTCHDGTWYAAAICACGEQEETIQGQGRTVEDALGDVVRAVYKHHAAIVMKKQGWRCGECGRRTGLQAHHLVSRSKGRSDAVSNLVGLCCGCHEKETNP